MNTSTFALALSETPSATVVGRAASNRRAGDRVHSQLWLRRRFPTKGQYHRL